MPGNKFVAAYLRPVGVGQQVLEDQLVNEALLGDADTNRNMQKQAIHKHAQVDTCRHRQKPGGHWFPAVSLRPPRGLLAACRGVVRLPEKALSRSLWS